MLFSILALCFSIGVALWLIAPHFAPTHGTHDRGQSVLMADKHLFKEQLRELELDFETGKTTENQYHQTKEELTHKLAKVLEQLERS